jgi:N-acetylneuraminic acid mutarotase
MKLNPRLLVVFVLPFLAVALPLLAGAKTDVWSPAGSLKVERTGQTATLLTNGQVLVTGGYNDSGEMADAEVFDPNSDSFSSVSALHFARTFHTATLLKNGLVLVVGGQAHGTVLASAEIFDPTTGEWKATGDLHQARSYHTATLLPDGHVLVAGGTRWASPPVFAQGVPAGGALDTTELYDPETGKWSNTDDLHSSRYLQTATLLQNGKVLVTGGIGAEGEKGILNSAEIYDPGSKTWTVTGSLFRPLVYHTATLLTNGQVLVAGGKPTYESDITTDEAELFNPSNGTWSPTARMMLRLCAHSATLMPNGRVLVVGGSADDEVQPGVESYDLATGKWEPEANLLKGRSIHSAALLNDGRLFVTAGLFANGAPRFCLASAEVYGPPKVHVLVPDPQITSSDKTPPIFQPPLIQPPNRSFDKSPPDLGGLASCLVILAACMVILAACFVIVVSVGLVIYAVRARRP